MAILQLPKQQRHPDVEEFIFSHFNVPTFTVIDERYRSYRVNVDGVEDDQVIDLALITWGKDTGAIGYIVNSTNSLLSGDFIQDDWLGGFTPVEDMFPPELYQDKFALYWRPQKKDPFEWLHEKGFYVVAP